MKLKITAGKRVRCIENTTTGPSITAGDKRSFEVERISGNQIWLKEFPGFFHYASEFTLAPITKAEMIKDIQRITQVCDEECRILSARIAYLNATDGVDFDETEFKVWQVLQEIKTMSDDVSKAKAIATIVKA